jgi:cytochrome P450
LVVEGPYAVSGATAETAWPIPWEDPYPTLDEMRSLSQVHYLAGLDCHLVVAHQEANAVLSSPEWSADPRSNLAMAIRLDVAGGGGELLAKSVLFSDPPDHQRLRRALGGHLTPRAVEQMRPRIGSIVDAAFCGISDSEGFEVMDSLAYPVPLAVICELLNVGSDAAHVLRTETPKMTAMLDPLASTETVTDSASAAFAAMLEIVPLVAERRIDPGDDLLSFLVVNSDEGSDLESDEAIMMILLLLAAGHETTANLIGNATLCLHENPDQARWLRRHPEHIGAAVEELLRFESPIQLTSRVAKDSVTIGGTTVGSGSQVLVSLGGANRDPVVFLEPHRLDLSRTPAGHLAFGHGIHFCAGASLARVEAQEVLARVMLLDPPLEDRELIVRRGLSRTFRRIDQLQISLP